MKYKVVLFALFVGGVIFGIFTLRYHFTSKNGSQPTKTRLVPHSSVVSPTPRDPLEEVVMPRSDEAAKQPGDGASETGIGASGKPEPRPEKPVRREALSLRDDTAESLPTGSLRDGEKEREIRSPTMDKLPFPSGSLRPDERRLPTGNLRERAETQPMGSLRREEKSGVYGSLREDESSLPTGSLRDK